MKWYISGPIKGFEDTYRENFAEAEKYVRDLWHLGEEDVVNPVTVGDKLAETLGRTPSYEEFMKFDIIALLCCDGIYMMQGWESSAGARCEHLVAVMSGLVVAYL